MKIAVKLGGSLSKNKMILMGLSQTISNLGSDHGIFLVPGGGHYADMVRKDDDQYHLSCKLSHRMALLAMSQYGYLLHHLINKSHLLDTLNGFNSDSAKGVYIWLPHADLSSMEDLPSTWSFTSDSIAAFAAHTLDLEKLILLKSVDGIPNNMPDSYDEAPIKCIIKSHELTNSDIVDPLFPAYLQGKKCWIINGHFPHRLEELLLTGHTYGTEVF